MDWKIVSSGKPQAGRLPEGSGDLVDRVRTGIAGARRSFPLKRGAALAVLGTCGAGILLVPSAAPFLAGVGLAVVAADRFLAPSRHSMDTGLQFLGNDRESNEEVWMDQNALRTHALVLGTAGSGRAATLRMMAGSSLSRSSGTMIIDGKGDPNVIPQMRALAREWGREDDLLVLDLTGKPGNGQSNVMNPFATGTSRALAYLLSSLVKGGGKDADRWKARATELAQVLMTALCWLRDERGVALDAGKVRDHLGLEALQALADPSVHPRMPEEYRDAIGLYLSSLPGFDATRGFRQQQSVLDRHGYLETVFGGILGNIGDAYGSVFMAKGNDIDMTDVLASRRILVVALPDLEKQPEEVADIGRFVVAGFKSMMSSNLGLAVSGDGSFVLNSRPVTHPVPFSAVLDDIAHYMVDDMALVSAQARSLGIGIVFGADDVQSLWKHETWEGTSVVANAGTRLLLRVEEGAKSVMRDSGEDRWKAGGQASIVDAVPDEADIALARLVGRQAEGEMVVMRGDKVVPVKFDLPARPGRNYDGWRNRFVGLRRVDTGKGEES